MKPTLRTLGAILLSVLLFTVFVYHVCAIQEGRGEGAWRLFPRDTAHWLGWIGFALLAVSAAYSGLKRGFPNNIKLWLTIHCIPGILSLLFTGIHVVNKVFHLRPGMILSFLAFVIMAVIVIGGVVGRYLKTTILSKYWRTLHIPLTAVFYVLLAVHLLVKTDMLVV